MSVTARDAEGVSAGSRTRHRLLLALFLIALGVLAADQVSKSVALRSLDPGEYVPLLGEYFGFQLVFNPGAAFSLATGSTWIFTVVAVIVAVVIVRISRNLASRGWALTLGALLGGNLGNLGDRLFRDPGFARGHVVDFLNYNGWFVGNVADIAIVLAAIGMAVLAFVGIGIDGVRHAASTTDSGADGSGADAAEATDSPEATGTDGADAGEDDEGATGDARGS